MSIILSLIENKQQKKAMRGGETERRTTADLSSLIWRNAETVFSQ